MKLVIGAIILIILFSGCVVFTEPPAAEPSSDLFTNISTKPSCALVTRTVNNCGVVDLEVDYNEYVCAVRNYRFDSSNIQFEHYDGNSGVCNSAFIVTIHNIEYFKGDFNVQLELSDHDQNHFTTISKKHTIDANGTREFYQKYNYACGQPHIVDVVKIIIPPKRNFCEWETKTRLDPTYVCEDVELQEEVCK